MIVDPRVSWLLQVSADLPGDPARISHQDFTAAGDPGMPTASRSAGLLDALSGAPAEPSLLRRLAEKPGEKSGPVWLCEAEQKILAQLRFPKRRNDWLLGRWTAKRLLCSFLSVDPARMADLEIRAAADGAPEAFLGGKPAPVSLSISHSAGVGFCAAAPPDIAIGCDVEQIRHHDPSVPIDYFVEEELAVLRLAPEPERDLVFTLIWSAKESALKTLRAGLRRDTRSVIVRVEPGLREEGWKPLSVQCAETSRTFAGWWRKDSDCILTIAVRGGCNQI